MSRARRVFASPRRGDFTNKQTVLIVNPEMRENETSSILLLRTLCRRCSQSETFAQEFVVRQAWSVSDDTPGPLEVLPRHAAVDSNATHPLISLIVPVWNDDELVVD